jgi:hypothetical protein
MKKIQEVLIKIKDWIQKNPKKSLLIGVFFGGFFLGAWLF